MPPPFPKELCSARYKQSKAKKYFHVKMHEYPCAHAHMCIHKDQLTRLATKVPLEDRVICNRSNTYNHGSVRREYISRSKGHTASKIKGSLQMVPYVP